MLLCVGVLNISGPPADEWKLSGQHADNRAIAGARALLDSADNEFSGIGSLWISCLLQLGGLFREKSTGQVFLSLGFNFKVAAGFLVEEMSPGYFLIIDASNMPDTQAAIDKLLWKMTSTVGSVGSESIEDFEGIPCEPCDSSEDIDVFVDDVCCYFCSSTFVVSDVLWYTFGCVWVRLVSVMIFPPVAFAMYLGAPAGLPLSLAGRGMMLRQTAPACGLIRRWLLAESMEGITSEHLTSLCAASKVLLVRVAGERSIGRKSHLTALVKAYLPELDEQSQQQVIERMLVSDSKAVPGGKKEYMLEVLKQLDPDDQQNFGDLTAHLESEERKELILRQLAGVKAAAQTHTPSAIKALRPARKGCVIMWDVAAHACQAYYPMKDEPARKHGTARNWGDKWTQLQCLQNAVTFVWNHHKKQGFAVSLTFSQTHVGHTYCVFLFSLSLCLCNLFLFILLV
jgi:hypothetical protein